MYRGDAAAQNQSGRLTAPHRRNSDQKLVWLHEIQRRGFAVGPRTWKMPGQRRGQHDEDGAEMVEFAFVVVLLIALLYGIVSYGLILSAQSTVTQAAADGARAGIVAASTTLGPKGTAESQAANDLSWMDKGQCYQPDALPSAIGTSGGILSCVATEGACASNASNQCLSVTVTYQYGRDPIFPLLPGLGVITPSTISSTDVLQISLPSS
jgi:Flp pilus assembly protein TadG